MKVFRREDGQTALWVGVALLGLIMVLGIGIDGGLMWTERRHMQNAADAGALAGARVLCAGGSQADAREAALDYSWRLFNHGGFDFARDHNPDLVTVEANKVKVVASEFVEPFFLGLFGLGLDHVTVSAKAAAACGGVTAACGLWPVAFDLDRWSRMWDIGCGRDFFVWTDDTVVDCAVYQCDVDGDGRKSVVDGGDRGWLDLSGVVDEYANDCIQPGCGENELGCLIRYNSSTRLDLPACISGASGVKAGVQSDVNSRIGDTVAVPLFESIGCSDPSGNCPGGSRYWVTKVGCITILGWETIDLPPVDPESNQWLRNQKVIRVHMNCDQGCMSGCGATDSDEMPLPWEYKAVSLTE